MENSEPMSRKQEFFTACQPDAHYIFKHENGEYDWDEIVNAFIAGGVYADGHPENPWKRFDRHGVWMETVEEHYMYSVYNAEDGDVAARSGNEIIHDMIAKPGRWTHYRLFEYP